MHEALRAMEMPVQMSGPDVNFGPLVDRPQAGRNSVSARARTRVCMYERAYVQSMHVCVFAFACWLQSIN